MRPLVAKSQPRVCSPAIKRVYMIHETPHSPDTSAPFGFRLDLTALRYLGRGHSKIKRLLKPQPRSSFNAACPYGVAIRTQINRGVAGTTKTASQRRRRRNTDVSRTPSRARRCRHPSFAPTFPFLATARGRRPFRRPPPSDPAGPPNTNAGNALRPSPAFLLLPPHAASPQFESCLREILEPRKLSGP
jgi:hypothetical protein